MMTGHSNLNNQGHSQRAEMYRHHRMVLTEYCLTYQMSVRLINARSCHFLFQFSQTVKMVGSGRKYGCSDIVDTFSPTFRNRIFRLSPIVKYENLDYKKSEIFKYLFDIHQRSNTKT